MVWSPLLQLERTPLSDFRIQRVDPLPHMLPLIYFPSSELSFFNFVPLLSYLKIKISLKEAISSTFCPTIKSCISHGICTFKILALYFFGLYHTPMLYLSGSLLSRWSKIGLKLKTLWRTTVKISSCNHTVQNPTAPQATFKFWPWYNSWSYSTKWETLLDELPFDTHALLW